jgi:hypothetical protein
MAIATELAAQHPIPPHQRLLALADAAAGNHQRAAQALTALLDGIGWMLLPAERTLMREELAAYRNGGRPPRAWPITDPLLSPPPFDAKRLLRDYPAVKPY